MACSCQAPLSGLHLMPVKDKNNTETAQGWLGGERVWMSWLGWFKMHPLGLKFRLNHRDEPKRKEKTSLSWDSVQPAQILTHPEHFICVPQEPEQWGPGQTQTSPYFLLLNLPGAAKGIPTEHCARVYRSSPLSPVTGAASSCPLGNHAPEPGNKEKWMFNSPTNE